MRLPSPARYRTQPGFSPDQERVINQIIESASPHVQDPTFTRDDINIAPTDPPKKRTNIINLGAFDRNRAEVRIKPDLELDAFRRTLAHEFQHVEQEETRPEIFDSYIYSTDDYRGYYAQLPERESRAAEWVSDREQPQPILWKREALARALGSSMDWEQGPRFLDSTQRPGNPMNALREALFTPAPDADRSLAPPRQLDLPFRYRDAMNNLLQRVLGRLDVRDPEAF